MTSATTPKTIELYGRGIQNEAEAGAAITPGMLIERDSGTVQPHSTAGGGGNLMFANEYGMTGGTIDDEYESGDQVVFNTYMPGSGIYALLDDGNDVSEDDFLISAGDGTLQLQGASSTAVVVAQARESVNSGASVARIKVELVSPFSRTLA